MANELRVAASLVHDDSVSDAVALQLAELLVSVTSKLRTMNKISVGTSERAIPLGDVAAPGWVIFVNRDTTNYVELRVSSGGAKFAKLKAGEVAILRLGSGAQVPYAVADTAACVLEYLLCDT